MATRSFTLFFFSTIKCFIFKNPEHVQSYLVSLGGAKKELIEKLYDFVKNHPIKCNVKVNVSREFSNSEKIR